MVMSPDGVIRRVVRVVTGSEGAEVARVAPHASISGLNEGATGDGRMNDAKSETNGKRCTIANWPAGRLKTPVALTGDRRLRMP
jgi:hypothetical protein